MVDFSKRLPAFDVQNCNEGSEIVLSGWASDVKNLGKIAFINLRDASGNVQLVINQDKEFFKEISKISKESVIIVAGRVVKSKLKSGGNEVLVSELEVVSRAEPQLPIDISGKIPTVLDKRIDNRFLDLRNPRNLAIFKIRTTANMGIREFLIKNKFIEMQTPKIISAGAEGGATLFSVVYYDKKAYLSQSGQLYKQMLMSAGFDRVFEIGPSFRAEKSHTMRHLTEFTQLDFEMSFIDDEDDVMKMIELLIVYVMNKIEKENSKELEIIGVKLEIPKIPFPRITYKEALEMLSKIGRKLAFGDDIGTEDEKKLGELVKKKHNTVAHFITKYPYSQKPFYIMTDGEISRGFDFEYNGEELVSGGQREHRYDVLARQISEKGLNAKDFAFYTEPFKYGMPTHGGFGLGIDRFIRYILKLDNIRDAVLFPRDPERVTP